MAIKVVPPPFHAGLADQTGRMTDVWQRHTLKTQTTLTTDVAPSDARYLVTTANPSLTQEVDLGALSAGYLHQTVAAGVASLSTTATLPMSDLSGSAITYGTDTTLGRGGATGQMTLSAGSTAPSFRLQNGSNAELGAIYWDGSNNFVLGTQGAVSGGTARDVILGSAVGAPNGIYLATEATSRWNIDASGHLTPFASATYDLGAASKRVHAIFGGALTVSVVTKTHADTPYTVSASDFTVLADATAGVLTVTLPTATAGRVVVVKKVDSSANAVTIGGTVDGAVNPTLPAQWNGKTMVADGTNWCTIAAT